MKAKKMMIHPIRGNPVFVQKRTTIRVVHGRNRTPTIGRNAVAQNQVPANRIGQPPRHGDGAWGDESKDSEHAIHRCSPSRRLMGRCRQRMGHATGLDNGVFRTL